MKNRFKIFVSLLISVIMTLQTACPVFAITKSGVSQDLSIEYSADDEASENKKYLKKSRT